MVTNVVGLVAAVLGDKFYWWIDPVGAIILALYTISNWSGTVLENAGIVSFLFLSDTFFNTTTTNKERTISSSRKKHTMIMNAANALLTELNFHR